MNRILSWRWGLVLFLTLFISSCASFKSGHYVQLSKKENLKFVSKKFGISESEIKVANPRGSFLPGEWVFVPMERGLVGRGISSSDDYSSYFDTSGHRLLWPVPSSNRLSSHFGHRWGRPHKGIDIAAKGGSHILSADSGVVIYSGRSLRGYGNMIVIRHAGGLYTVYAHNRKNLVRKGQKVHRGEVIGQVGKTGRSTGNHLHFEVRHGDRAINPLAFFNKSKYKKLARH